MPWSEATKWLLNPLAKGYATTAALYAFGEQPQQFLPNLVVKDRAINPQLDTAQPLADRRECVLRCAGIFIHVRGPHAVAIEGRRRA